MCSVSTMAGVDNTRELLPNDNQTAELYSNYKYARQYFDLQTVPSSSNCSMTISTSGTLVRPDEVVILVIVFSIWGGAIALFIHRWGKIRSIPYIPSFEEVQRELRRELEDKLKDERLSILVTDLQQAMLSSRRQSMFPAPLPQPPSPCHDPFYWHQNSSASQPIRRPSEQSYISYKPLAGRRRGTDPTQTQDYKYRRSSCFSRVGVPGYKPSTSISPLARARRTSRTTPSPFMRGSSWISQKGDTIQEVKETPSPVQCQTTSIQETQVGDNFNSSESFSSLEIRNSNGLLLENFSGFKACRFGGFPSGSKRFSTV